MRIVIDAMGGDNAPVEIALGAAEASLTSEGELILVGQKERLESILGGYRRLRNHRLTLVDASDVITMDEKPGSHLRRRDNASMVVAARMLKNGEADAFVCAGNTGALHQVCLLEIGRIEGLKRPALAVLLPGDGEGALALDLGANVDCKPEYLEQWSLMGSLYAKEVLHRKNPRVGLANIGTEVGKGNMLIKQAYERIVDLPINFVGSVEPLGVFRGEVDVVICDGFVGNMFLKTAEAVGEWVLGRVKMAASSSPAGKIGGFMLRSSFRKMRQDMTHSDHGGAIMLGLKGIVVKCHGRADAKAVLRGIDVAEQAVRLQIASKVERLFSS